MKSSGVVIVFTAILKANDSEQSHLVQILGILCNDVHNHKMRIFDIFAMFNQD